MTVFDKVDSAYSSLPHMKRPAAEFMRNFIVKHDIENVIEIGFYHGKSSAYFAAIMEDRQKGHLTTIDQEKTTPLSPSIHEVLGGVGLSDRVTPIFATRSYTWELKKLITRKPRPQFDLCYFDGGHTWDATGFGFLLVDMLLKPGGWIIFDDMNWSPSSAIKRDASRAAHYRGYSEDELMATAVRLVFENIAPYLGYINRHEARERRWGIAQKPAANAGPAANARPVGMLKRLLGQY